MSENRFADATSLTSVVHQIVGAGSMCWEYVDRAGVFDSETAQEVASEGSERILELFRRETTDHYAEAERLLAAEHRNDESAALAYAAAQVHATLATVQRSACPHDWIAPTKIGDGEGSEWVRVECALCGAVDDRPDFRTIPWPPSDELVETVASMLEATDGGDYDDIARAVLDAIGGAGDE